MSKRPRQSSNRIGRYTEPREISVAALLLTSVLCFASLGAEAEDEAGGVVSDARTLIEKWVETRRIISKEQRDWTLGREMLSERIDIVQHEIESLRAKIADAEGSIAEADKKRAELIEENEKLKEASSSLDGTVVALEERTQELLKRLPDPIRERVRAAQPAHSRQSPTQTKLSLAERFQNVVGILNEVNKFNREITVTSEVRDAARRKLGRGDGAVRRHRPGLLRQRQRHCGGRRHRLGGRLDLDAGQRGRGRRSPRRSRSSRTSSWPSSCRCPYESTEAQAIHR